MNAFFRSLFCFVSGVLFFALCHPGFIAGNGIAFVGYIALAPVFYISHFLTARTAWLWGFLYGIASYAALCYWLYVYSPIALLCGLLFYGLIVALVLEGFVFIRMIFPNGSFYISALLWCIYEYIKTKGFLGFSYGIIGYSQWTWLLPLQSAALGGVWVLSALCAFFSAILADFCLALEQKSAWKTVKVGLFAWLCAFCLILAYGAVHLRKGTTESEKQVSVLCVQNNTDSNKYGFDVYKRDVRTLMRLTEEGIASAEKAPDFVLWPETAVVPPIVWNYEKKTEAGRLALVNELLSFMQKNDACFVVGNQMTVENARGDTDDYNATLVFDRQAGNVIPPRPLTYAKMHLVPFTEYFPYQRIAPRLYKMLLMGDTHLWTPGTEATVFECRGVRFSTPICFEDTFGALCREFAKRGADCFFMVSNDSWSQTESCQSQHLAMAVFRCVENALPGARSTASGITCAIDAHGQVHGALPMFSEGTVVSHLNLALGAQKTLYTKAGDWVPLLEVCLFVLLLCREFLQRLKKR